MGKLTTVLVHEWVTGGGMAGSPLDSSWAAEGRAMRRAIAADFASLDGTRVVITLDHRLPDEPGPWTIVRVGPGAEEQQLARLAQECHHVVLIAPESSGILAARARLVGRVSKASLGSSAEAIEATSDKIRLGAHLRAHGIATPPCLRVVPAEGLPEDFPYPAVLKPIDGCGSIDTYHILGPGRCPESARDLPQALLQPWVPGLAMSASFLVDRRGRAALIGVGQQHMECLGGRYAYRGGTVPADRSPSRWTESSLTDPTPHPTLPHKGGGRDCPPPPLWGRAGVGGQLEPENSRKTVTMCFADGDPRRAVESVKGLRGLIGVDFLWSEATRKVTVLEINPRPTTSCVALTRLLPPGKVAGCWINAVCTEQHEAPVDLAGIIHAQRPLRFDADGTILDEGGTGNNS